MIARGAQEFPSCVANYISNDKSISKCEPASSEECRRRNTEEMENCSRANQRGSPIPTFAWFPRS